MGSTYNKNDEEQKIKEECNMKYEAMTKEEIGYAELIEEGEME